MGFLDIFKKKKTDPALKKDVALPLVKGASATIYPDKIIIATVDTTTVGYWLTSITNISIIPAGSNNDLIGAKVMHHLNLSLMNQPPPLDFKEYGKSRLKAEGFKTNKSVYFMAKHLAISLQDFELRVDASINGGGSGEKKGFRYFKEGSFTMSSEISNAELGEKIRQGWDMCKLKIENPKSIPLFHKSHLNNCLNLIYETAPSLNGIDQRHQKDCGNDHFA